MGDPNANSTFTMKMNRIARRRLNNPGAGWVGALKAALGPAGGFTVPDIAEGNFGAAFPTSPPAATAREVNHIRNEVPPEIAAVSKAIVGAIVRNDKPAAYSVVHGAAWEVRVSMMVDADGEEYAVTWVNPTPPASP